MLEYWNIEFGGMRSVFIGLMETKKIKSDYHPLLIPNIPLFHYSIIP